MKKNLVFIGIGMMLLSQICCTKSQPLVTLSDWEIDGFKGKIKKATHTSKDYGILGAITDVSSVKYITRYNSAGTKIEMIQETTRGSDSPHVIGHTVQSKYDGKGYKASEVYSKNGAFDYKWLYKYNEQGLLAEQWSEDGKGNPSSKYKYVYDEKANKIAEIALNQDGSEWARTNYEYVYDAENRVIDMKIINSDNSLREHYAYQYDTKNKTDKINIGLDGGIIDHFVFQYDAHGNLQAVKSLITDAIIEEYSYEYYE
jgi:hypothetical protein